MAETVNMLEDTHLSHFLRTAAGLVGGIKAKSPLAQVSLTLNGVELSLVETFKAFEIEFNEQIELLVVRRAADLVTEAGLQEVVHKLRSARLEAMRAFTLLRERVPSTAEQAEIVL